MQAERSRKSLWESWTFNYLAKLPETTLFPKDAVILAANFADSMLEQWDKRWNEGKKRPQGQDS